MPCSQCGKEKVIARGLCSAHYHQFRRHGTIMKVYQTTAGSCRIEGCDRSVFAKGLCQRHYLQADHPLKASWKLMRSRNRGNYDLRWDDFATYLSDVGERPYPMSQLRRIDETQRWDKDNVRWSTPVLDSKSSWSKEKRKAYAREWGMQRRYGITVAEYDAILASQGGVCAICQRDGATKNKLHGFDVPMHVDHHHATGKVRGILCTHCNTAIGLLQDSPAIIARALAYLRHYESGMATRNDPPFLCDIPIPSPPDEQEAA